MFKDAKQGGGPNFLVKQMAVESELKRFDTEAICFAQLNRAILFLYQSVVTNGSGQKLD